MKANKLRVITSSKNQSNFAAGAALELLEAPNHARRKRKVLDAINNLSLKVTAGTVAEKTGMPVLEVTALLNRIAYETQAQLVADSAGAVTYKFAPGFESSYLLSGSKNFLRWVCRVVFNAAAFAIKMLSLMLFLLFRISFGVLLIASVVVVVVLIIAAIVALVTRLVSNFSDAGDLNGDGGDDLIGSVGQGLSVDWLCGIRYWTLDWIWDWWFWPGRYFWWDPWDPWYHHSPSDYDNWSTRAYSEHQSRPAYVSADDTGEDRDSPGEQEQDRNFLDNCFSVLFGTGDPNAQREVERWAIVAQAIKAKCGVVLAEDLAPYVDTEAANEHWMLPILIRFNGCPDVTESGKLVYSFAAFLPQNTPAEANVFDSPDHGVNATDELNSIYTNFLKRQKAKVIAKTNAQTLPPFIQEQLWTLTGISAGQVASVIGFACFASVGAIGLLTHAADQNYVLLLRPILLGISAYAGLFILLPLMRWPWVWNMNSRIERRNAVHAQAAQRLAHPDDQLAQYQREADELRRATVTGAPTAVYTTEEDLLEQEFKSL